MTPLSLAELVKRGQLSQHMEWKHDPTLPGRLKREGPAQPTHGMEANMTFPFSLISYRYVLIVSAYFCQYSSERGTNAAMQGCMNT